MLTRQAQAENSSQRPALVSSTLGTSFTYQGRLTDGGSPANGTYDFQFDLYDAATGGSPVGSTSTQSDITVTDGLFTVTLDFGSVFDGTALWLKISVRPGSSTGAYTALTPRQALTAAPYALGLQPGATIQNNPGGYALGIGGGNWDPNSSEGDFQIGDSTYKFKIGVATGGGGAGDARIRAQGGTNRMMLGGGANDVLTITDSNVGIGTISPTAGKSLHVQTASTTGTAVYGYASATSGPALGVVGQVESTDGNGVSGLAEATTGSAIGVYGRSNSPNGWGVYSNGNAHVEGQLTWKPITSSLSIPPAAFNPADNSGSYIQAGYYIAPGASSPATIFYAPVNLPQGAIVTQFTFHWYDASGADGTADLNQSKPHSTPVKMASALTSGSAGQSFTTDTTIVNAVIDNTQYSYFIALYLPDSNVIAYDIFIEYTIDRP
ncbi:MAG: hypothetical protein D6816_00510, partial [Bacteroidetes bacterium]